MLKNPGENLEKYQQASSIIILYFYLIFTLLLRHLMNKKRGETVRMDKYFAAPHNMKPCDGMFSPRMAF